MFEFESISGKERTEQLDQLNRLKEEYLARAEEHKKRNAEASGGKTRRLNQKAKKRKNATKTRSRTSPLCNPGKVFAAHRGRAGEA